MKKYTFSLDDNTKNRLEAIKAEYGMSYSEAIRRAIYKLYIEMCVVGYEDT